MNKYHNKKVLGFDSKKEKKRFEQLSYLERLGEISELKKQVAFELIPLQKDKDGRVIERAVKYVADFVYKNRSGDLVVEDVKSVATRTRDYIIKRKLMLYVHGIVLREFN